MKSLSAVEYENGMYPDDQARGARSIAHQRILKRRARVKFLISADIEGVAGVTGYDQVIPGQSYEWERARQWMTEEVLAAVEGARDCGIDEIIVADSHSTAQNILFDRLPSYVKLIRGEPRPLRMVQGVEEKGVVGCAFIGYHASTHHPSGLLAHTYSGLAFRAVRINGKIASEAYANAAVAGHFGVPLVAISGDDGCIDEIQEWLPDVETVVTKRAYGRQAMQSESAERVRELIRSAVKRGIQHRDEYSPFLLKGPIAVEIEFIRRLPAELLAYLPMIERSDTYSVKYMASDMAEAMKFLVFASHYNAASK